MLSIALHGAIAALILFLAYQVRNTPLPPMSKIMELVAGPGDNFAATAAPAATGPQVSFDIPSPPTPARTPPQSQPEPAPQPQPVAQTPPPPARETPAAKPAPPKPADSKPAAQPKPTTTPPQEKKMTLEEFNRLHNTNQRPQQTPRPQTPPKVRTINTNEIVRGVTGGSTNVTSGAGGRALTRDEGPVMDAYFAMLRQRLREAFVQPPGLADTLVATLEVRIAADGSLTGARIARSSGSQDFDRAVLAAVARTRMPPRPDGKGEQLTIPFHLKELIGG